MSDNSTPLENCLAEKCRRQRTAVDPKCKKNVYFLDKRTEEKATAFLHLPSDDDTLIGINDEVYNLCSCGCNLVFDEELNMYIKRHINSEYDEYPKYAEHSETAPQKLKPHCRMEKVKRIDVEVTAHPMDFVTFTDEIIEIAKESAKPLPAVTVKKYNKRRTYEVVD